MKRKKIQIEVEAEYASFIARSIELRARDFRHMAQKTIDLPDSQKTKRMHEGAEWQLNAAEYAFGLAERMNYA